MTFRNRTFVVFSLSKLLNGRHEDIIIAKELIQQKSTKTVSETFASSWIYSQQHCTATKINNKN